MGTKIPDKIDVVIPAHEKDIKTLPYCVARAKKCIKNVGKVFIISKDKLVDNAEWFDESQFPFSKKDVERIIKGKTNYKIGWHFQQLLKFYSLFTIPNVSKNVLVLDSDTVFYKKTKFVEKDDGNENIFYLSIGKDKNLETNEFSIKSRKFIKKMLPNLNVDLLKENGKWITGICHHILLNRDAVEHMFSEVCKKHKGKEFWKVFLELSSINEFPSEYELYFTFMLNNYSNQIKLRRLKYKNTHDFSVLEYYAEILRKKYDYCSYHEREYVDK
ncbi:hypothetical protein ACFL0U_00440 [Pseudomonadota bacterium]